MTTTKTLRWEDPQDHGERARGRGPNRTHLAIAAELRRHPGRWALLEDSATSLYLAQTISTSSTSAWGERGDFEATSRQYATPRGLRYRIWARYVGGGSS